MIVIFRNFLILPLVISGSTPAIANHLLGIPAFSIEDLDGRRTARPLLDAGSRGFACAGCTAWADRPDHQSAISISISGKRGRGDSATATDYRQLQTGRPRGDKRARVRLDFKLRF